MTELPKLQEHHKIPLLSSTYNICPQPSHVSHYCAVLTYELQMQFLNLDVVFMEIHIFLCCQH